MLGIEYGDFLDLMYDPHESELVCEFAVEAATEGRDIEAVAWETPALATALEQWWTKTPR